MYKLIATISTNMRKTKLGLGLYDFLESVGLRAGINRLEHWKRRNVMLSQDEKDKNIEFFKEKSDYIDETVKLLADDESKIVLKSMIKYRCTGNYHDLPHNVFHTQYFINDFFPFSEGECFVDCGAYDGDSIIGFKRRMKRLGIKDYKIVAFEPDHNNITRLKANIPLAQCIEKGVWSEETVLSFSQKGESSSSFLYDKTEENTVHIPVTTIDKCEECRDATFIKMDIEGSESEALKGAEETIRRNKPKLAICIYHSNEDMLRLIHQVHALNSDYKLYVRQHTNGWAETVLYAC